MEKVRRKEDNKFDYGWLLVCAETGILPGSILTVKKKTKKTFFFNEIEGEWLTNNFEKA